MNFGIGYSTQSDSFAAGQDVIQMAQKDNNITDASLVLAFCTNHLDQNIFVRGMASQLAAEVPIVGGTTIGVINNQIVRYNQPVSVALIFDKTSIIAHVASTELIGDNEEHAGAEIARNMGCGKHDKLLFLLYNMIKKERQHHTPPRMNSLLSILQGIENVKPSHIPIFGAGSVGDFQFSSSTLFNSQQVSSNLLIGISLCGHFVFDYVIMHGCTPIDGIYHTITKSDGNTILELDGQPAMQVINDIYGSRDWQRDMPVKELTIGVNHGDKFEPYKEENYVSRLIAAPYFSQQGIITPEPDWQPGTEIQLLIRDNEAMLASTKQRSTTLLQNMRDAGKTPRLGLYIDCAGRTSFFSNSVLEEALLVQETFNEFNVPLFGFYSGLEIAPFFNQSRGLEWTGVLLVLAEEQDKQ